jgi:hypothetical protein
MNSYISAFKINNVSIWGLGSYCSHLKTAVFCDVTPCSLLDYYQHFRGTAAFIFMVEEYAESWKCGPTYLTYFALPIYFILYPFYSNSCSTSLTHHLSLLLHFPLTSVLSTTVMSWCLPLLLVSPQPQSCSPSQCQNHFHASFTLIPWRWMDAASSSIALVTLYQTIQHHIPEDHILQFLQILNVNNNNVLSILHIIWT